MRVGRFLIIATLIIVPIAGLAWWQISRGTVAVQLLALNDFHGNLEPPGGATGLVDATPAGGAEYLATHLKRAVAAHPNSIIVAAGDLVGASPLVSGLFHDEPAIESLNAMGLAVSSVGNHEFDEGWRELLRLQDGGCHPADGCQDGDGFEGARFQYLAANVVHATPAGLAPILPGAVIHQVGGLEIGFIGETRMGTRQEVTPAGVQGLTFLDEAATANDHAARLVRQGVRAIVLLIHEGGRQRTDGQPVDPNGCAGFTGALVPILKRLSSDIRVVISGHTHWPYNCTIDGRSVTSAGSNGRVITKLELVIDRATGVIARITARNEIVGRDVPKDVRQTEIIAKYGRLSAPLADRRVGSVTAAITAAPNRAGESALGDVIADAHLASTRTADRSSTQPRRTPAPLKDPASVAFMNPDGIRTGIEATGRPGTATSEVTYAALFAVQPFGNVVTTVTMTGEMIKRLLEQQFDNPGPGQTRILQVSGGFSYRYRLLAPAGGHVDPRSIMIGGRRIEPEDRVRVAANDFLVAGGDGFTVFLEGSDQVGGEVDIDALAAYFEANSPIRPGPQDRVIRTD